MITVKKGIFIAIPQKNLGKSLKHKDRIAPKRNPKR